MIVTIPLKGTKAADLNGRLVATAVPNGPIVAPAAALQKVRDRLMAIETLTVTTGEAVAQELLRYHGQLLCLERRFDAHGAELQLKFPWRNAWRHKEKALFDDLGWERVCVLFNTAAAHSYCASLAQPKGPAEGGLKEATQKFQLAAGCLDLAHDIVKDAIWGLTPRWNPAELTADMSLDMLQALRDLMLAQAQRAFYEKAVTEGLRDGVTAKLAAQTAALFGAVLSKLSRPELAELVTDEGSMFRSADKSFLGRVQAGHRQAQALAEWHVAREHAVNYEYGRQVARLKLAAEHSAAAAAAAESAGLPAAERQLVSGLRDRLKGEAEHAARENSNIYLEDVPPPASLPPLEARLGIVKAIRPEPPAADVAAVFAGLLPDTLKGALRQHNAAAAAMLHQLGDESSRDAESAKQRLRELELPQAREGSNRRGDAAVGTWLGGVGRRVVWRRVVWQAGESVTRQ